MGEGSAKETTRLHYLHRLAELYPTIAKASTEVINLQSILNLPKGTEHFITDIHGEFEAFSHVLRNGSGSVKRKIDDVFGHTLAEADKSALATLIYYPREKMALLKLSSRQLRDWYRITLYRLIEVCKRASSKYTRSKVRKALPADFAYVIEELITEKSEVLDKEAYYDAIVESIIETGRARPFIIAMCELIQRMVVDHLHILGDIYDRGSGAVQIMDTLMNYHSLDIQWGNHDILWMGAAAGSLACIATVIRISARYGNLDVIEDGYGINMLPLATFALDHYGDDPCEVFRTKGDALSRSEEELNRRMHKAISVIQFKLEGQLIARRRGFDLEDRRLLHRIDYKKGTITLNEKKYKLLDRRFPTVDPEDPYRLTDEEKKVMERLQAAFVGCEKLHAHVGLLLKKGGLYKVYNNNLLYHGCIPLDESGKFLRVGIAGRKYAGKRLYDTLESYIRKAFFATDERELALCRDLLWYTWISPNSPLFGKDRMATFERYFLAEKETHVENKNPYYRLLDNRRVVNHILREFGLGEDGRIVNGHVPVMQKKGESPVHCDGRVLVIDGGFSRAYQPKTGIAGYTLIFNSYGMSLAAHKPFTSAEEAVANETDIHSDQITVMTAERRLCVGDTDNGRAIKVRIEELNELIAAYRNGSIIEKN